MSRTRVLLTGADSLIGSHILGLLMSGNNLSVLATVGTRESAYILQQQYNQKTSSALDFQIFFNHDMPGRSDDALNSPNDPFHVVVHILTAVPLEGADCLTRFTSLESDAVTDFLRSVQRLAKQTQRVVLISSIAQFAWWLQKEETPLAINQDYVLATSQAGDNIIYSAVSGWIAECGPQFDVVYITAPSLYGPAIRPLETSSDVLEANRRIWDLCSNEYRERIDMPPYGIANFVDVRVSQLLVILYTKYPNRSIRTSLLQASARPSRLKQGIGDSFSQLGRCLRVQKLHDFSSLVFLNSGHRHTRPVSRTQARTLDR
jgi:hypothetical protein